MHKSRLSSLNFVSLILFLFLPRFTTVLCVSNERCRKFLLHKYSWTAIKQIFFNRIFVALKINHVIFDFLTSGPPVSFSDSSFSLNEYWNDVDYSSRDEGYLELQWDLPKDMSLAEKFVLRFDEFLSKRGINRSDNVFQVDRILYYFFIRCIKFGIYKGNEWL